MLKSKVMLGLQVLRQMREAEERVTVLNTAADLDKGESNIEQVFSVLRKAGLVVGKRGPGGGYTLVKNESGEWRFTEMSIAEFTRAFYPYDAEHILMHDFVSTPLAEVIL